MSAALFLCSPSLAKPDRYWFKMLPASVFSPIEPAIPTVDPSLRILFDGRIWNQLEACRAGGLPGDSAIADLVAFFYQRDGELPLEHLRGHYVLAVADQRRGIVLVGQDLSGSASLYYGDTGPGTFAISADIRNVLAFVSAEVDTEVLPEHFMFGQVVGPRTVFKGIKTLPPFESLRISDRGLEHDRSVFQRLWCGATDGAISAPDAVDRIVEIIGRCMSEGVPAGQDEVWNTLSGGVDSSLLQCLLAERGFRRSASVAIRGTEIHHRRALEVANIVGSQHSVFTIEPDDLLNAIRRGVELCGLPGVYGGEAAALCLYEQLAHASKDSPVIFAGDHADAIMGDGSPLLLARLYSLPIPRGVTDLLLTAMRGRKRPDLVGLSLDFRKPWPDASMLMRLAGETNRASIVTELFPGVDPRSFYHAREELAEHVSGTLEERVWKVRVLASETRCRVLQMKSTFARSFGVTLVQPFADYELSRLMAAVPNKLKVRWFREKYLAKRALLRYLPRRTVLRHKTSNFVPYECMTQRGKLLGELVSEIRESDYSHIVPGIKPYLEKSIRCGEAGGAVDTDLLLLVNFHIWYREVVKKHDCAIP